MSPTKKRSRRTAMAAVIGAIAVSAMAFAGAAPAFASDQGQGQSNFKPYEVHTVWRMDAPDLTNPKSFEFPQTRLLGIPEATCTPVKIQSDMDWIRSEADALALADLKVLRSSKDDARFSPHDYYAAIIVKPASECPPAPPATPTPTVVTTYGEWQGGTPTCENPSVTQTRSTEVTTTTYTWDWNGQTLQYVKTAHVGQPVAGESETRIVTYTGDDCTPPVVLPDFPAPPKVCAPAYTLPVNNADFTWSMTAGHVIATRVADGTTHDYGLAPLGSDCPTSPANPGSNGNHSTPPSTNTGSTTKSVVTTVKRTAEAPQTGGVGDNGVAGIIWGLSAAFAALVVGGVGFVMRRRRRA